jgi:hypothetical protein
MGWRFRKSINMGAVRLNLSKRGVGMSTGFKGFRIGQSADGRQYMSIGIPGTGISYMHYFKKPKRAGQERMPIPFPQSPSPLTPPQGIPSARLILKRNAVPTGEVFHLGERSVIGRSDPETGPVNVDLGAIPEADYVSRHHAEIWRDASGQWFIRDLGSRNGTFVHATPVTQLQRLNDGDEIVLGKVSFEFRMG